MNLEEISRLLLFFSWAILFQLPHFCIASSKYAIFSAGVALV